MDPYAAQLQEALRQSARESQKARVCLCMCVSVRVDVCVCVWCVRVRVSVSLCARVCVRRVYYLSFASYKCHICVFARAGK